MRQIIISMILLFAVGNCVTYHMHSASSIGDNVYVTAMRDSGNPYDPERFQYKVLKCKSDSNDNLNCENAIVRGMSEYAE